MLLRTLYRRLIDVKKGSLALHELSQIEAENMRHLHSEVLKEISELRSVAIKLSIGFVTLSVAFGAAILFRAIGSPVSLAIAIVICYIFASAVTLWCVREWEKYFLQCVGVIDKIEISLGYYQSGKYLCGHDNLRKESVLPLEWNSSKTGSVVWSDPVFVASKLIMISVAALNLSMVLLSLIVVDF